jgi:predicted ATPase/DNA-binding SARP family transcriptional activator/Tfp pilus assembly protein PilF
MPGVIFGAAMTATRRLELSFLGPFEVTVDGKPVTGFSSDKIRALLAYLAVEGGQPHRREALAGLLWPDHPDSDALVSLRQAIYKLRLELGSNRESGGGTQEQVLTSDSRLPTPFLLVTPQTVQLDSSAYQLDVEEFSALVDACRSHRHRKVEYCSTCHARFLRAAQLYRGDFLAGFLLQDSQVFDEWVVLKREALRRQALEVFESLATHHESRTERRQALPYVYRQLEMEPWLEEAHRRAMRLLALDGQRSAAIAQYETCRRVLREEFGIEPEAQTTTLYESIKTGSQESGVGSRESEATTDSRLPTPDSQKQNLPQQLTPFIGREEELARINELLDSPDYHLITLVGLGGVGKTRLALQAAQEQVGTFDDGVHYVPLAAVGGPELMASSIAQAIGLHFAGSEQPDAQLLEYLRDKEMLLVLDSFEHLLGGTTHSDDEHQTEGGTDLLVSILKNAPKITMLVTSRERLGPQAEHIVDILGLPYAEADDGRPISSAVLPPADSGTYPAVRLFVERAQRVYADFALSVDNAQGVLDICRLVEGLPLGIVLAAAWTRHFPTARIAKSISDNLDFLKSSPRETSAQHSSLRAVFNHSWNLLPEGEQQVLRKLSVFRGGWDEDAAEKVAGASVFALSSLVDKSLLRRDASGRFSMHEVVRQYAAEQLQAMQGEQEETQAAHAAYFLDFAERAESEWWGPNADTWLAALDREHNNFRAALRWASGGTEHREPSTEYHHPTRYSIGLRMAATLWGFWFVRGYYGEGWEQLERVLSRAPNDEASKAMRPMRAKALNGVGTIACVRGDYTSARSRYEESLAINRELRDQRGMGLALGNLGVVAYYQGDYTSARSLYEESLAIWRELGDKLRISTALSNLGNVANAQGDHASARSLYEESLAISRELEDELSISSALVNLGAVAYIQGDYASARSLYEESLVIRRELGDKNGIAFALSSLGNVAYIQGDYATARSLYKESLVMQRELGEKFGTARCLAGLGGAAVGMGREQGQVDQVHVGTKLLGAAEALLGAIGAVLEADDHMVCEQGVASARAQLSAEEFERAWAEGRAMGIEQTIECALQPD